MSQPLSDPARKQKAFHEIMYQEFWLLTLIGGSYGFTHTPGWKALTYINYFVLYSTMMTGTAALAYTSYLIKDHISLLSQTSHFLVASMVVLTASIILTKSRSKVEQFADIYNDQHTTGFAKTVYFDGLIKKSQRKKVILILTWATLYGTCGLIGLNQPLIELLSGRTSQSANINGVWTTLLFPLWVPLDLENSNETWLLVYLFEVFFLLSGLVIVTSAILICFVTAEKLLDQVKLTVYGIETLNKRAKALFRQRFPGRSPIELAKEFDDCYYDCVVESVKHHHYVMGLIDQFLDLASVPISVPFYGGAILLGMAMITITAEDDRRIGPKCLAAALSFTECYNMYLLCRYGQNFIDWSNKLYDALFFAGWHERSVRCMKAVFIMRYGCSRPITINAGKLMILNMERFSDLVNSAYSLFNLNAASKS